MSNSSKLLKAIVGDQGLQTLEKMIYKKGSRSIVNDASMLLSLLVVPRAIMSWLVKEIKPMKTGEQKTIAFPSDPSIKIHVWKQDVDQYRADFIKAGSIIHSFENETLPSVGQQFMSAFEMYGDEDVVKIPKDEFIDEHEKLVDVLREGSKKERDKEAKDQEEELEEETSANSIKPVKAIMDISGASRDFDPEAIKWTTMQNVVKELSAVTGRLVDALVARNVSKDELKGDPQKVECIKIPEIASKDEFKDKDGKAHKLIGDGMDSAEFEEPEYTPYNKDSHLTFARIINRHNKRRKDTIDPHMPIPKAQVKKADMPAGAGMAKKPSMPMQPKPPVPAGKNPAGAAAKQAQASSRGHQAKPPTAPKNPSLKPPTLKEELNETEDFLPPGKKYFRKKLEKIGKVAKGEKTYALSEDEILSPCPHCNKPEFIKSEGKYKFTPCYCFKSEGKFVDIIKTESGYEVVFDVNADKDSVHAFLLLLKSQLLLRKGGF